MINPDIFGYGATVLNVVMLIPQVYRTARTKDTKALSLTTLLIFIAASLFWLFYGIAKAAIPIIITNSVVGGMNVILAVFKLTYK